MMTRLFAAAVLVVAGLGNARAATYFDTINIPTAGADSDGPRGDGVTALADSFFAPASFNNVQLQLTADNPTDGGSTTVFLLPATITNGQVNAPSYTTNSNGSFGGFTGGQALFQVADSALSQTSSRNLTLVSQSVAPTVTSANGVYWLALAPSANSSVEWWFGSDNSGTGLDARGTGQTTPQQSFFYDAGPTLVSDLDPSTGGPYALVVSTPEPASLAVLGSALAGIGLVRRRGRKRPVAA